MALLLWHIMKCNNNNTAYSTHAFETAYLHAILPIEVGKDTRHWPGHQLKGATTQTTRYLY